MSEAVLVTIDLDDEERSLMMHGLNEYFGPARGQALLAPMVGCSTIDEFYDLVLRLKKSVINVEPLSDLDWVRALVLTEICWASDVLGAGIDFATNFRDEKAAPLLRSMQRKINTSQRLILLRDNAKAIAS
ncbi:hypothetical protein [Mycobacterium sp. 1423905.2]|uniref:hypothetical protein n=1 Tax=Mycobacterium sp. 1423905.2 TaxID=1856859 RepID=UPI0007FE3D99|nr:hypothetical protein [Mycobacterium sp. 1423905.2]OBJ51299.1 hypothetical protein A9W95_22125 [Mycobacterium sp. 1423905.2]